MYWYGGSGNWSDYTNHWSNNSGNSPASPAANAPTSTDDAIFDGNSNATAYTVTIDATANCANLTVGNPGTSGVTTVAGGLNLNIYGNLSTATGVLVTHSGTLAFKATSGTKTITTNGVSFGSFIEFNGSGGTFQLVDDLTFTRNLTLTAGTFDPNGRTVTMAPLQDRTITGTFTFYDLIFLASSGNLSGFILASDIIVSHVFTITGASDPLYRCLIKSNILGTARTVTAAAVTASYCDFRDITGAGAASWDLSGATGGSGNCGGNAFKALGDAAFTAATTQHWVNANGGSWGTAANWTSAVPLPQDTAAFDCTFNMSKKVTVNVDRLSNIDFTGATWTTSLTFNINGAQRECYGSLTLIAGLTWQTQAVVFWLMGRGNFTITGNGATVDEPVYLKAPGGVYTLKSDLTISSANNLNLTNGTLTAVDGANNWVISAGVITVSSGTTLTLGSGTHLLTGTGTVFNGSGTITASTGTIKITDTSNTAVTFAGGTKIYNNLWFSRGASTGDITISGTNTFADFKDDGSEAHSIKFTAGTTQTVTTFTVSGTAGKLITITSTSTATHALIQTGLGVVSSDYLSIQHSVATPTLTWYAGANSTNNQADATAGSGWIFTVPPAPVTPNGSMFMVF